ncbi:MAG: P1 family peptidase [Anaerolineales bacterium]|nr:P1 family peptidase [Anaerolineales bacterium]
MTHYNALTDVPGLRVGHWSDRQAATGCTVVLCPQGAVAGVDVRGSAPGTRETDLLHPLSSVQKVHAILLAGGSAFGLAAADGVMRWLEERGHGYPTSVAAVPIVPAAILYDLAIGRADVRPDAAAGYAACEAARRGPLSEGNVGAGVGATVGKMLGFERATKAGLGTASKLLDDGTVVAALAVTNALGEVYHPQTQQVLAGARHARGDGFADSTELAEQALSRGEEVHFANENTTLAIVATNVAQTKAGATKVAQMAHDGLARVIRPLHLPHDGDTVFALSSGERPGDAGMVGAVAAAVVADAVIAGIFAATSLAGVPAARDLGFSET